MNKQPYVVPAVGPRGFLVIKDRKPVLGKSGKPKKFATRGDAVAYIRELEA